MHHAHSGQRHINCLPDLAISTHNHVLHMIHPLSPCINHCMHLFSFWVDLWVRRKSTRQGTFKIIAPDGLQLIVKLHRAPTCFYHWPRFYRRSPQHWCSALKGCRSNSVREYPVGRGILTGWLIPHNGLRYQSALPSCSLIP